MDLLKYCSDELIYLFNHTQNIIITFRYSVRCKPDEILLNVHNPEEFTPPHPLTKKIKNVNGETKISINLEGSGDYILFKIIIDNTGIKLEVIEGLQFLSKDGKNRINKYIKIW